MAIFQIEDGSCVGRGFSGVDADGLCAKFKAWVVKTAVNGGPEWNLLLDRSALPVAKTITSIDIATEIFTSVGHGFYSGESVIYTASGTAISGLYSGTTYYIRKLSEDTFDLHTTLLRATNSATAINISGSLPSGTHTIILKGPYIVVAPSIPAGVNSIENIVKFGYYTSDSGLIRVQNYLSWDDTNKILRGLWSGFNISTVDAGNFAYDFRGGIECMFIATMISTTWSYALFDIWEGITKLVEAPTVIGTAQSGITAGSNVVVQLDTGEASLFTVGNYYYIYDFNNINAVNYVKIASKDNGADTITLTTLSTTMTAGAIIGAYPHRYYAYGTGISAVSNSGLCVNNQTIPYISDITNVNLYTFDGSLIQTKIGFNTISFILISPGYPSLSPDDVGLYACMKPVITEMQNNASTYPAYNIGTNRMYGKAKNMFVSYGSMAQMLNYRTINSKNYLKIDSSTSNYLFLHSTSVS